MGILRDFFGRGFLGASALRMKCGTKITPCGDAAWGRARKKHAPERRNRPAETKRRESCAFQARAVCGAFPKRALRVAHGVTFVSPRRGVGAKAFLPSSVRHSISRGRIFAARRSRAPRRRRGRLRPQRFCGRCSRTARGPAVTRTCPRRPRRRASRTSR